MVMMKTFGVIIAKALPKSRHKRSDGRAQGVIRGDQREWCQNLLGSGKYTGEGIMIRTHQKRLF
jgi:hypothetical protein